MRAALAILCSVAILPLAQGTENIHSERLPKTAELPGSAGFRLLPSNETGITFSNTLPVTRLLENQNFMNGSGVAAGDFDGDGLCDLYFCAISGSNALYRNLGNWRFEDVTSHAGVGCPMWHSTGTIFSDADGDGKLDLFVATLGRGVHYFHNEGNGTFKEMTREAGLVSEAGSTSLAMADVDGDGDLDLYVTNYGSQPLLRGGGSAPVKMENGKWVVTGPYAKRLHFVNGKLEELGEPDVLYLNDGKGHFKPVPWNSEFFLDEHGKPRSEPWDFGLSVQMRDINGDGAPDIYVTNDFQTPDRIWLNDGRGHFRALPILAMRKQSFSAMGVDFADVDRDGLLDFVVVEMRSRKHSDFLREVVGMKPLERMPGIFEYRPEVNRNTFFHNRGDGTFEEIANMSGIAASDWSWQAVFMDVDLDGYEDLLVGNGMLFDLQDRDVLARIQSMGAQSREQTRTNLLLHPSFKTPNVAFRNRGDLTFEDASARWNFHSMEISQGFACADLDGDGDLDLAVNNLDGPAELYKNVCTMPRLAVRLKGLAGNDQGVGSTIRVFLGPVPMQMQEILCGGRYLSGDDALRVFSTAGVTGTVRVEVSWRSGKISTVEQVPANTLLEISETSASERQKPPASKAAEPLFQDVTDTLPFKHHEELFDDYARQPLLMKQLSQLGPGVAWFDLDGDGEEELILGSGKGGFLQAFRWRNGKFEPLPEARLPKLPDDTTGFTAWSLSNGRRSLFAGLSNYEAGRTNLPPIISCNASNRGPLTLSAMAGLVTYPCSPGPIAAADIDGDGELELFVGGRVVAGKYPRAGVSMIYRQGPDHFFIDEPNTKVLANVGMVSGATWSDLDGDGFPELVLACEWGPVRIFKNEKGRLREMTFELGLADLTGWWNGVATADLDEDGRMDIIASNWGLNTGYSASLAHPLKIYYGEIQTPGLMDIIESAYEPEFGTDAPVRSLASLGQAFPALLARFKTHNEFARVAMPAILSLLPRQPEKLSSSLLASAVFLNRGTNFIMQLLPRQAQLAPCFSVNVADVNGDGHDDVFLSQNFFPMRPEWERLDGGRGLILLGDGKGGLRPLSAQESGIAIYGEQRGAAFADFDQDGRVDLVVAQNGAAARVFRNARARPGSRVKLQGPPGNPDGIGAALRVESAGVLGARREIHGGGGYWSQESVSLIVARPREPSHLLVRWPGRKEQIVPFTKGEMVVTFPN